MLINTAETVYPNYQWVYCKQHYLWGQSSPVLSMPFHSPPVPFDPRQSQSVPYGPILSYPVPWISELLSSEFLEASSILQPWGLTKWKFPETLRNM